MTCCALTQTGTASAILTRHDAPETPQDRAFLDHFATRSTGAASKVRKDKSAYRT
jgi:hypothetical protein